MGYARQQLEPNGKEYKYPRYGCCGHREFKLATRSYRKLINMDMFPWDILPSIEAGLTSKPERVKKGYARHPKPPYSYLGMVATIIYNSETQSLPLRDICERLEEMFPLFFKGSYKGWKDSIRHNLTYNSCFIKTNSKVNSKFNYWTLDLHLIPEDAFKRQVSGTKHLNLQEWGPTLHEHLNIPAVPVPYQYPALTSITSTLAPGSKKRKSMMDNYSVLTSPVSPPTKRRKAIAKTHTAHDTSSSGINFSISHILSSDSKYRGSDSACTDSDSFAVSPACVSGDKTENRDIAEAVNYVSSCFNLTGENLHRVCQDFEQSFRQICPTVEENSCSSCSQVDMPTEIQYDQPTPFSQLNQQSPYYHPTPSAPYYSNAYYMYSSQAQEFGQCPTSGQYPVMPQDVSYMQTSYTSQPCQYSDVPLDLS